MIGHPCLVWPDERLKQPAIPFDLDNLDIRSIFRAAEVAHLNLQWVGASGGILAASMFAYPNALIIRSEQSERGTFSTEFWLNPEIVVAEDLKPMRDSCMCVIFHDPLEIARPTHLVIECHRLIHMPDGSRTVQYDEMEFRGPMAQIVHHEMEHLQGKTVVDHLGSLKRQMVRKKAIVAQAQFDSLLFEHWTTFDDLANMVSAQEVALGVHKQLKRIFDPVAHRQVSVRNFNEAVKKYSRELDDLPGGSSINDMLAYFGSISPVKIHMDIFEDMERKHPGIIPPRLEDGFTKIIQDLCDAMTDRLEEQGIPGLVEIRSQVKTTKVKMQHTTTNGPLEIVFDRNELRQGGFAEMWAAMVAEHLTGPYVPMPIDEKVYAELKWRMSNAWLDEHMVQKFAVNLIDKDLSTIGENALRGEDGRTLGELWKPGNLVVSARLPKESVVLIIEADEFVGKDLNNKEYWDELHENLKADIMKGQGKP